MSGAAWAARRLIGWLHASGLATWERRSDEADVLMITNVWPHSARPTYGPFVKYTWEGLAAQGVICDVLFVRGYRGLRAYLAGAAIATLLPLAYPRKYRLVHSHGGETALAARCYLGAPVLGSYLGTDLLGGRIGGTRPSRIKCQLRSVLLRLHAPLMSATTTKSAEMAQLLPARARSRNTVIADGVDHARFFPGNRERACAQLGWESHALNVLFAGRADAVEKRLWLAQRAVRLARRELPEIRLRILSDVPPDEMPRRYVAADCLLHTSASEGSSNVIKEALACNLPVIATPAGDTAELLADVERCRLCGPEPQALAAALVEILRVRGRSDGRARTAHLNIDVVARRTLECYQASLHGSPQATRKKFAASGVGGL